MDEGAEALRLRLRLELDAAQAEVQHLRGCIARLLRYAKLPPARVTSKSFSRKNTVEIAVPARAYATAAAIAHKYREDQQK